MNQSQNTQISPLEAYTTDLTKLAEEGKLDPVIGRDEEIRRVMQVLSRRTKNNPVLVGEPGVGKTAVAEGLALAALPAKLRHEAAAHLERAAVLLAALVREVRDERRYDLGLERVDDLLGEHRLGEA